MKIIDMHSHFGTESGYLWRGAEVIAKAEEHYKFKITYRTEEEMAQDMRDANVKSILDLGFTMEAPMDEVREVHDYSAQLIRDNPDAFLGLWVCIDPKEGLKALRELERCIKDLKLGFVGFCSMSTGLGIPPSDKAFYPFYDMCVEAGAPVLIMLGITGWGARHPGGRGFLLEHCHPRYLDEVAAKFPDLNIIASRPAWPWQTEAIAVMLHKPNIIGYELHGWSPKYLTDDLKWEINHRLADRVMFGADYPIFSYERLFGDWKSLGYSQETMEALYYKNAQRILGDLGYKTE